MFIYKHIYINYLIYKHINYYTKKSVITMDRKSNLNNLLSKTKYD